MDKGTEIFLYLLILSIPFSKTAVEVSICFIIFFWTIRCVFNKNISLPDTQITLPWLVFLLVCALSLFNTNYFELSLKALFTKQLKYFFFFVAISEFLKKNPSLFKNISYVFLTALSAVIIDAVLQYVTGTDIRGKRAHIVHIEPKDRFRISASFSHPNDFGTYLTAMIPLLFLQMSSRGLKGRSPKARGVSIGDSSRYATSGFAFGMTFFHAFSAILVFLGLIALYFTYSRGALLAFIAAISTTLFLWKKKIALIVFTALLLFVFLTPFPFMQSLRQSFNFNMNASGSIKDRLKLWKSTANMIAERPVLGWGLNTYTKEIPKFVGDMDAWYPHNCYLQMASEIGLVGLSAFLILLVALFLSFYRSFCTASSPHEKLCAGAFIASFLAIAFHAFVDTTLFSLPMVALFWTIVSVGYAFKIDSSPTGFEPVLPP